MALGGTIAWGLSGVVWAVGLLLDRWPWRCYSGCTGGWSPHRSSLILRVTLPGLEAGLGLWSQDPKKESLEGSQNLHSVFPAGLCKAQSCAGKPHP